MRDLKKLRGFFLFIPMIVMAVHCSREKSISVAAFEKEKFGNLSEALFDYHRALKINPEYGFANKRIGFILSESQLSIIPAIHHLQKAKLSDPLDIEIILKLMDLTLFIKDFSKFAKLLEETKPLLKPEIVLHLETIYACLKQNNKQKMVDKMDSLEFPEETFLYYRSMALCYELGGRKETAENYVNQFRMKNNQK